MFRLAIYLHFIIIFLFATKSVNSEQTEWIEGKTIKLQTLDKITARISTIDIKIGVPVRLGTLEINVKYCAYRPPEEPPEDAAFLEVRDLGYNNKSKIENVFSGWMFASSPAISSLEHAVYDVTILKCLS
tara:strand:+ start:168 stop:557 length:390 start_codon:yes stop_codon:yes gene_type:complete